MAWYNSLKDLTGDIGSIVQGHNPSNQKPPVSIPTGGPSTIPFKPPTGQTTSTSTQPVLPNLGNTSTTGDDGGGGGIWDTVTNIGGDILSFIKDHGGDIAGAIADYAKKYGTTALEAWNIYESAQRQAQADQYGKDAVSGAKAAYDAKSGLRSAGIQGMLTPGANAPNLSSLHSLAGSGSGNPFARGLPVAPPPNPMQNPSVQTPSDGGGPTNPPHGQFGLLPNTTQPNTPPTQNLTDVLNGKVTPGTLPVAASNPAVTIQNGFLDMMKRKQQGLPVAPPNPTAPPTNPTVPPVQRTLTPGDRSV